MNSKNNNQYCKIGKSYPIFKIPLQVPIDPFKNGILKMEDITPPYEIVDIYLDGYLKNFSKKSHSSRSVGELLKIIQGRNCP